MHKISAPLARDRFKSSALKTQIGKNILKLYKRMLLKEIPNLPKEMKRQHSKKKFRSERRDAEFFRQLESIEFRNINKLKRFYMRTHKKYIQFGGSF